MKDFKVGMKIYGYDWYWKYGLGYEEAAKLLREQGVDFVIAQNEYIPSMNTAVEAEVPASHRAAFKSYNDKLFRESLKKENIEYWASALMFFNPNDTEKYGNYPVNQYGERAKKIDWYIGACPTCEEYVDHRIEQIIKAAKELSIDGVFLGFMRFPGFWETWLPGTNEERWEEYCFCDRCMKLFSEYIGMEILGNANITAGQWIRVNVYKEYTSWKCKVIRDIIKKIRERIGSGIKIMLNTLPFDKEHFGDSGTNIFAQNIELLNDVVDVFEIMGYHQILGLPGEWVAQAGSYFKQLAGNSKVVCTVQGKPSYLDGMPANKGRKESITLEEFSGIIHNVKEQRLDGVVVYAWSDFLEQRLEHHNTAYIDALKKSIL